MPFLPSRDQLTDAYLHDLAAAWAYARARHANHTPYAFVLYGIEGGPRLDPFVLTEQDLDRAARKSFDNGHGYHDSLDESRDALRYAIADVGREELYDRMPTVDALLAPHRDTLNSGMAETAAYQYLIDAAIPALEELDRQGTFGTGPDRHRILLVVITEDVDGDWMLDSAKRLNPSAVAKRFEEYLRRPQGAFASCSLLAASADGRSLYLAGSRDNPKATSDRDTNISEIVACDLAPGPRPAPKRRWAYTFAYSPVPAHAFIVSPDSRALFVLRVKVNGGKSRTSVLRFDPDYNQPTREHEFFRHSTGLALSRHGDLLTVADRKRTLHFFDPATLHPLQTRTLNHQPEDILFLPDGRLLAATGTSLLQLPNPQDVSSAPTILKIPATHLSADASHTVLAISHPIPLRPDERNNPHELTVDLLSLPALTPATTVRLPGHHLAAAVLSPDGQRLAANARQIGGSREFIAIFDTATGIELGRRKYFSISRPTFLPDSRTLALPTTGITTIEPIEFWTVPT